MGSGGKLQGPSSKAALIFRKGYNLAVAGRVEEARAIFNSIPYIQLVAGANEVIFDLAKLGAAHSSVVESNLRRAGESTGQILLRGFEPITPEHHVVLKAFRKMYSEAEVDSVDGLWLDDGHFKQWRRDSVSRALAQVTFTSVSLCLTRGISQKQPSP